MLNQVTIFLLLCIFNFLVSPLKNLIQQSDFQNYDFSSNANYIEWYVFLGSNLSNWYNFNLNYIEIKKRYDVHTTVCADLSSDVPYTLCQNVQLTPGAKYRLSYTIYCQSRIHLMDVRSFVNSRLVSSLFVQDSNQFGMKNDYFIAQQNENQICFNETHVPQDIFLINNNTLENVGGCLDNITLHKVEIFLVKFLVILNELDSQIQLRSNLTFPSPLTTKFIDEYVLYVQDEIADIEWVSSSQNYLSIKMKINKNVRVKSINFILRQPRANNQLIQFQISIAEYPQYFYALQLDQKHFTTDIVMVASSLGKIVGGVTAFFKTFICSYFLFNLISFQMLSFFYIFLNLSIFPQFLKNIYYELLGIQIQYSSIVNSIQRLFGLSQNPILISSEEKQISNLLEKQKGGNIWFAQFGMTTLFWDNNGENIIIICMLFLKLTLLKCIGKKIYCRLKKRIRKVQMGKIIAFQLYLMIPTMIIPSIYQILTPTTKVSVSIQKCLHLILASLIAFLLSIHFVIVKKPFFMKKPPTLGRQSSIETCQLKFQILKVQPISYNQFKNNAERTNDKKVFQSKQKIKISSSLAQQQDKIKVKLQFVQNLFLLTNPAAIIFGPVPFFLVNTPLLLLKLILTVQNRKSKAFLDKIFASLTIIVQMTHHFSFLAFFLIELGTTYEDTSSMKYQKVIGISLVSITTVVAGTIINLLKFIFEGLCILGSFIKQCWHLITNNKILVEQLISQKKKKEKSGERKWKSDKDRNSSLQWKQNILKLVKEQQQHKKQRQDIQKVTCYINQKTLKSQVQTKSRTKKIKNTKNY